MCNTSVQYRQFKQPVGIHMCRSTCGSEERSLNTHSVCCTSLSDKVLFAQAHEKTYCCRLLVASSVRNATTNISMFRYHKHQLDNTHSRYRHVLWYSAQTDFVPSTTRWLCASTYIYVHELLQTHMYLHIPRLIS